MYIISGMFKGRKVMWPEGRASRATPTVVREALFNMLLEVVPRARFLELSAGGGAIGLEALSRGAAHATFVESDSRALAALRGNISKLRCGQLCHVHQTTAHEYISNPPSHVEPYDVVYLNPQYDEAKGFRLLPLLFASPLLTPQACVAVLHEVHSRPPDAPTVWREIADRRYGKQCLLLWQRETDPAVIASPADTRQSLTEPM